MASDPLTENVQRLTVHSISRAPRSPGIYAWYARVPLEDDDWKPLIIDDEDQAPNVLLNAISDYAAYHRPSAVKITGSADYEMPWLGTLTRSYLTSRDPAEAGEIAISSRIGAHAAVPSSRRALTKLLRASTPIFAAPLYVGVATDLQLRLQQHLKDYDETYQKLRLNHANAPETTTGDGYSFGSRAAISGIPLDYLDCWTLPIDLGDDDSGDDRESRERQLAEQVEWVLQRIFLPPLGRR